MRRAWPRILALRCRTAPCRTCEAKRLAHTATKTSQLKLADFTPDLIRNFAIIAHIDHGKSSLSDRLLELTGSIEKKTDNTRNLQVLDTLKVERERGITVKAQSASMIFRDPRNSKTYLLNLVDTPGHVDFASEVARSLLACQGALLLVDATQGIQAQTLSVLEAAKSLQNVIGVVNKIDLPNAEPEKVTSEVESLLEAYPSPTLRVSAKTGSNCESVLEAIVDHIPAPSGAIENPLKALVFDTHFDEYRGVVSLINLFEGRIRKGDKIQFLSSKKSYEVNDTGILTPTAVSVPEGLYAGQIGYITCGMKNEAEGVFRVGDTIHPPNAPVKAIADFKPMRNMVFSTFYPQDAGDFSKLDESVQRLALTDRAVTIFRESSAALGQGLRLGFLGALHMDVFRQRLEDEYAAEVIITRPFVPVKVLLKDRTEIDVRSAEDFPSHTDTSLNQRIKEIQEPVIDATILVPEQYVGAVLDLCSTHRGIQSSMTYLDDKASRLKLVYQMPLSAIVTSFHSNLKSVTSGFASLDYVNTGYAKSDLVKLLILINGKSVDALCAVVHRSEAEKEGKETLARLKKVMSRQNFEIILQASIGGKILSRERIAPFRKDVTSGLYGGHYERKMKHLVKQKEGKKRLKRIGNVELPQEAFYNVLSLPSGKSAR